MHRAPQSHRFRFLLASAAVAAALLPAVPAPAGLDPVPLWTGHGNQLNANFGYSVAAAGDVNGDGFSDLLVGARGYDAGQIDEGRAYLYLGSATGPQPSAWFDEGDQLLAFYASSVAGAGDVDGDGYGDAIVGAPSYDGAAQNGGRVCFYRGGPGGLSAEPDRILDGTQMSATFGCCVARAGDVNGDGYDDVVIGERGWDGAEINAGRALVFHGGPAGLDSLPAWTREGAQGNEAFGWSAAGAGDVNGDGYDDVIVGAFFHDGAVPDEGAAWIYPGSASGILSTPIWSARGGQSNATFGWSVAGAGDVNGDGFADVIVGARYYDAAFPDAGRAFVFLGAASGMDSVAAWTADGNGTDAFLGWSVGAAGDVNGDGYADVVVGAYAANVQWIDDGEARVYLGGPSGPAALPAWSGSSLQQGAGFGWSVAGGGDVDGDGFGDVIVGAYFHDDGQDNEGAAMLFRGAAEAPSASSWWKGRAGPTSVSYGFVADYAGDVNGDGYTDVLATDPLADVVSAGEGRADVYYGAVLGPDTSPSWSIGGAQAGENLGRAACGVGDVDGDGYDDVLVGSPYRTQSFPQEGRASLYPGSAAGLALFASRQWTGGAAGAELGASVTGIGDADGDGILDLAIGAPGVDAVRVWYGAPGGPAPAADLTLTGGEIGARFGAVVASAGDVNGDGYADLVVGEPLASGGSAEEGAAHVWLGGPGGFAAVPAWSVAGGELGAQFGSAVGGAGDTDGDGFADVFVVAPLADGAAADEGTVSLYRGGAGGPELAPAWTFASGQGGAQLDRAAPAGDVNGDGFDDLLVGVSRWTGSFALEGRVLLFAGSDSGLAATPSAEWLGGRSFARLGSWLAGRGDPDGSGWGDLLFGARGWADSSSTGGAAFLFPTGGVAPGAPLALRQRRADDTAPVAIGGLGDAPTSFRLRALGGSAAGRVDVSLLWEVKPLGAPFDGAGTQSLPFVDPGPVDPDLGSRASFDALVTGLAGNTPYRWRARIVSRHPVFPGSPWFTLPGNGAADVDLRTPGVVGASGPLPASPPAASMLLRAFPSPFRGAVAIRLARADDAPARGTVRVHDVAGRLVASLHDGPLPDGLALRWDGRDREGRPVAPGVYWVRAEAGASVAAIPVVRLR